MSALGVSVKRGLSRGRSSLEEELQDIQDERLRRKSTFSVATQIVFLEMDLHGLFATRSFSHRKMLSYLLDNINTFDNMESSQNTPDTTTNSESSFPFSRESVTLSTTLKHGNHLNGTDTTTCSPSAYYAQTPRTRRRAGVVAKKAVNAELIPIQLKDIRRIEYVFNSAPQPLVFVRRHVVVISFTPIRIIILADRLLLFIDDQLIDCALKDLFVDQLKTCMEVYQNHQDILRKKKHGDYHFMSFEFSVYEAVFGAVIEIQKEHLRHLEMRVKKVSKILKQFSIVPVEVNEKVREHMDILMEYTEKAKSQRRVIAELLEDKNLMALMHLTKLREDPTLYSVPLKADILNKSEETEALLESYLMDYNAILKRLGTMKLQLESSEAIVSYRLEHGFNMMLIGDTVLAVMTASLTVGIYMAGLAGMNVGVHGYEDVKRLLFQSTVFISTFVIAVFCVVCIVIMQKYGILPKSYSSLDIF